MIADDTLANLEETVLPALEEWKETMIERMEKDAEFLASIDVSTSSISEESSEAATDDAMALVEQIKTV